MTDETSIEARTERMRAEAAELREQLAAERKAREEAEKWRDLYKEQRDNVRGHYEIMQARAEQAERECLRLAAELLTAREALLQSERERDEARQTLANVAGDRDRWMHAHDEEKASRECAERERDALRRYYDAAAPEHNLLALLDLYHERKITAEADNAALLRFARDVREAIRTGKWSAYVTSEAARLLSADHPGAALLEYTRALEKGMRTVSELVHAIGRQPHSGDEESGRHDEDCEACILDAIEECAADALRGKA